MDYENGDWVMRGLAWDDPLRIRTPEELIHWVDEIGFLPLFQTEVPGFSAEEHTASTFWFTGDPAQDPWEWREIIARSGQVAYGKFFNRRAGFISREWFPHFANWHRDGYDFDARWEDSLANAREKRIMDLFPVPESETDPDSAADIGQSGPQQQTEWFSWQVKASAGFGKGGEKNFEGIISGLQMQSYLLIRDFRRRTNRKGNPYGMPNTVYATPESLWGYDHVTSQYSTDPQESRRLIFQKIQSAFPGAGEKELRKALG